MDLTSPIMRVSPMLARGENARVEVHKDLNGGCKLVVTDAKHPTGYTIGLSPQNAVQIALVMLEAAGVPIQAEMARRMQQQGGAL